MKVLIVTCDKSIALSTASALAREVSASDSAEVSISTSFQPSVLPQDTKYDSIVSWAAPGKTDPSVLAALTQALAPSGRLAAAEPSSSSPASADRLQRELLVGGLVEPVVSGALADIVLVVASKPAWAAGAKQAINLKKSAPPAPSAPAPPAPAPSAWKLGADEDEELIDEDELLTAEDLQRPTAPAADDCEVGQSGRKACKNCSCGRAEMEEGAGPAVKVAAGEDLGGAAASACGNCYLGDAFRCGTCPYKGLPAFKPGEKITLMADTLMADA